MKLHSICTLVIFATAILTSCSSPMQTEDLNGYWEITSVTLKDGTEKNFTVNPVVDFIDVTGKSGTRTKVKPQFNGTFISTGLTEEFTIKEGAYLFLNYKTSFDTWEEEVLSLTKNEMRVKNRDGKIYTYKTFIPFSLKTK